MTENLTDLGDGWKGRGTPETRVAFHEDGSTVVFQDGTLMAEANGVTPRVLAFLFGDKMPLIASAAKLELFDELLRDALVLADAVTLPEGFGALRTAWKNVHAARALRDYEGQPATTESHGAPSLKDVDMVRQALIGQAEAEQAFTRIFEYALGPAPQGAPCAHCGGPAGATVVVRAGKICCADCLARGEAGAQGTPCESDTCDLCGYVVTEETPRGSLMLGGKVVCTTCYEGSSTSRVANERD